VVCGPLTPYADVIKSCSRRICAVANDVCDETQQQVRKSEGSAGVLVQKNDAEGSGRNTPKKRSNVLLFALLLSMKKKVMKKNI
jgi:hypothetical protein